MAAFENVASLNFNNVITLSNTVTGEYTEVVAMVKTATLPTYSTGSTVTYVLNFVNNGTTDYTNLTLTDNLGAYSFTPTGGTATTLYPLAYTTGSVLYYLNGELQATPTVTAEQPLTITGLNIPAGGAAIIVFNATPTVYAPMAAQSTIVATATLTGTGLDEPVTASATITVANETVLSMQKSLSPSTVSEGDTLTYTFLIQNTGNRSATTADSLVLTDDFSPILSNITVTLNGTVLASTAYTYDTTTGLFTIPTGTLSVPSASVSQSGSTGIYTVNPGTTTVTVSGTV